MKGSRSSNTVLKGVEENRNLYVGRCDPNVSTDDIVKYIQDEINIEPLNCDLISKPDLPVKSFRVCVRASDVETLLQPDVWPENICVRRYYNRSPTGTFYNERHGA